MFATATVALKEWFEPATCKLHYLAELQTWKNGKGENWDDLTDELKSLADKACSQIRLWILENGFTS